MDDGAVQSHEMSENIEEHIKVSGLQLASFLELVTEVVFKSGVLNQLQTAQKLDVFDIEGAIHSYYDIISQPCTVCEGLSDDALLHQYSFLHSLPLEESLKIVREYLIAATAKDCSLMISFRPREDGESASEYGSVYLKSLNRSFDYKKTVISVDMLCSKCKKKVMKLVAGIEGINSIILDSSKGLATIVGDADPAEIIRKMRKFRKSAEFVSIGPPKDEKKDEKKDPGPCLPRTCQKCDVWYVIGDDDYNYCSIL